MALVVLLAGLNAVVALAAILEFLQDQWEEGGGRLKARMVVAWIAPMTRLSQEEGLISPHDWKLNAEGQRDQGRVKGQAWRAPHDAPRLVPASGWTTH